MKRTRTFFKKKNISKNQLHLDQQNTTIYIDAALNQNFESEIQLDEDEICIIENENDNIDFVLKNEKNVSSQYCQKRQ